MSAAFYTRAASIPCRTSSEDGPAWYRLFAHAPPTCNLFWGLNIVYAQ